MASMYAKPDVIRVFDKNQDDFIFTDTQVKLRILIQLGKC